MREASALGGLVAILAAAGTCTLIVHAQAPQPATPPLFAVPGAPIAPPVQPSPSPSPATPEQPTAAQPPSDPNAATPTPTPAPTPNQMAVCIDLAKQRLYLKNGDTVVLESPVSSGRTGHLTPTGNFSVLEKDPNHKSNMYGNFIKPSNGRVVQRNVDSKMPAPAGAIFEGAPMKFFVRFEGAAGTHAGYLPGHPASHGCVRMPAAKAEALYNAVALGTPVFVYGDAPVRPQDADSKKESKPAPTPSPTPAPTPKPKPGWWPFGKKK